MHHPGRNRGRPRGCGGFENMSRVVCPLCKTGFEANISAVNFAVNCVSCGVAFSAAHFLHREHTVPSNAPAKAADSVRSEKPAETASPSTKTAGLAFMHESGTHAPLRRVIRVTELTPLPKPVVAKKIEANGASVHVTTSSAAVLDVLAPESKVESKIEAPVVAPEAPAKPELEIVLEKCSAECPTPPETGDDVKVRMATVLPGEPPKSPTESSIPKVEEKKPFGSRRGGRRPLLEGSFGPYEILGEIARGGVGAVFKAKDTEQNREVALKVLLDGPDAGDSERERFRHECETAKALSLPGMVQVYAVGEIEGRPYMAMELIKGRSLDRIIPEKSLGVNDCLVLMKSVAETIGALHEAGYVHRDLKPGNILLDEFGTPKVADFGLVKSLDEVTRLTASGLVCGTPAYMAPEQARGDGKAVDPRSDVWALGAVLYEMLTCKPPFQAENALRLMLRITKEAPRPPREINLKVPQDVQAIVLKCLEKNAERRYANARAMAADIAHFLNGEAVEAAVQRSEKFTRLITAAAQNRRTLKALGIGIAAVLVVSVLARIAFAPKDASPLSESGYQALLDTTLSNSTRLDRAEKYFREALAIDTKHARSHLGLGLVLGLRGVDPQTRRHDPKLLAEALSETFRAGELDAQLKAEAHAQAAKFYLRMKNHVDEVRELERAVEFNSTSLRFREALGMAYWNAGAQTGDKRYFKNAEIEFRNILQVDASYPRVRNYLTTLREQFLVPGAMTANRR